MRNFSPNWWLGVLISGVSLYACGPKVLLGSDASGGTGGSGASTAGNAGSAGYTAGSAGYTAGSSGSAGTGGCTDCLLAGVTWSQYGPYGVLGDARTLTLCRTYGRQFNRPNQTSLQCSADVLCGQIQAVNTAVLDPTVQAAFLNQAQYRPAQTVDDAVLTVALITIDPPAELFTIGQGCGTSPDACPDIPAPIRNLVNVLNAIDAAELAVDPCRSTLTTPATCVDGVKNGDETDVDCGGSACAKCEAGQLCTTKADCAPAVCSGGLCSAPSCVDAVENGDETDVDCGGAVCAGCGLGKACLVPADCAIGLCAGGVCSAP